MTVVVVCYILMYLKYNNIIWRKMNKILIISSVERIQNQNYWYQSCLCIFAFNIFIIDFCFALLCLFVCLFVLTEWFPKEQPQWVKQWVYSWGIKKRAGSLTLPSIICTLKLLESEGSFLRLEKLSWVDIYLNTGFLNGSSKSSMYGYSSPVGMVYGISFYDSCFTGNILTHVKMYRIKSWKYYYYYYYYWLIDFIIFMKEMISLFVWYNLDSVNTRKKWQILYWKGRPLRCSVNQIRSLENWHLFNNLGWIL